MKWISRNSALVSGNPLRYIPETTVNRYNVYCLYPLLYAIPVVIF